MSVAADIGGDRPLCLTMGSLKEAPPGPVPPVLLWRYANMFGAPAIYRAMDGERPVAWICGVADQRERRFDCLPERLYGLVPYPGAIVDLDSLRGALARTDATCHVVCAPAPAYCAADLLSYHRMDTFLLEAPSVAQAFASLHSVGRQGVRKAERCGVTVTRQPLHDGLASFYSLYREKCRRHGAPAKPTAFFDGLADRFGQGAEVFLAHHQGSPVAAVLSVTVGDYALFADGSSRADAWPVCPNNLAVWDAARSALESGVRVVDYGLTLPEDKGGARFKEHLGGTRTPVYVVQT